MTAKFWDKRAQKYNDDIERYDAVYLQTVESTKSLLSTSDVVLDLDCASGEFSIDIVPCVQRISQLLAANYYRTHSTCKAAQRAI